MPLGSVCMYITPPKFWVLQSICCMSKISQNILSPTILIITHFTNREERFQNLAFEYRNSLNGVFPLDAFPYLVFWLGRKGASARGGNQRMELLGPSAGCVLSNDQTQKHLAGMRCEGFAFSFRCCIFKPDKVIFSSTIGVISTLWNCFQLCFWELNLVQWRRGSSLVSVTEHPRVNTTRTELCLSTVHID